MRKHILNLLVFTLFGISSVMAQFSGSGTLSDPYIIASDQDLQNLATAVNAGNDFAGNYFKQTADINLIESQLFPDGFTPIGVFDGNRQFSGTYDGDGALPDSSSSHRNRNSRHPSHSSVPVPHSDSRRSHNRYHTTALH